jgi:hypothetical protein
MVPVKDISLDSANGTNVENIFATEEDFSVLRPQCLKKGKNCTKLKKMPFIK